MVIYIYFIDEVVKIKRDNSSTIPTEECTPPSYIFPSEEQSLIIEPLFPKDFTPKVHNIIL